MEPWEEDFIKQFEGFRKNAYKLDGENEWTIGYGIKGVYPTTGKPVKKGDTITEEQALKELRAKISQFKPEQIFSNWDKFSKQARFAIIDIMYNGGANNLKNKSPRFVAAINDGFEDGKLDLSELKRIMAEMSLNYDANKKDRVWRRMALISSLYNPQDNININYATTKKSPYYNFNNNVVHDKNLLNVLHRVNQSEANFAQRLNDPDRETILDWSTGKPVSFKFDWLNEGDHDVIYSGVQQSTRPQYFVFGSDVYTDGLTDYTDEKYSKDDAFKHAVEMGDTIHVSPGMGSMFVTRAPYYYNGVKPDSDFYITGSRYATNR